MKKFYFLMFCGLLCAAMGVKADISHNLSTNGALTITNANNATNSSTNPWVITSTGTNSNPIVVETGLTVYITLDGVTISSTNCAFEIQGSSTVYLTLASGKTNTLTSGPTYAGLAVPSGATLVIDGDGTLTAEGGAGTGTGSGGGAGIGGSGGAGLGGESGDITISSGTIIATGGNGTGSNHSGGGAGIGGGGGGSENGGGSYGNIKIEHANITAHGGSGTGNAGGGAGIGGGGGGGNKSIGGYFGNITISECDGTAAIGGAGGQTTNGNGGGGAGIGGGGGGGKGGAAGPAGGTISTDGSIPATGGAGGPGGGGAGSNVGGGGGGSTPIITINSQPASQNVLQGETVTLTISAGVTHSATLSYQWYSTTSSSSNTGGTLISGATGSTYNVPTISIDTYYYYCVVSATGGATPVNSSVATVIVNAITYSISVSTDRINFGSIESGSTLPAAVTVTITNDGTGSITLDPLNSVLNFTIVGLSSPTTLVPGNDISFTVQPTENTTVNPYSGTININGTNGIAEQIDLSFAVTVAGKLNGTVTIDQTNPRIGDVLSCTPSINISDTEITYEWYVGTTFVGTSATYTVSESDNPVGETITVTITSTNSSFPGSLTSTATAPVLKAAGPAAPAAPTVASKTYNSITLTLIAGYEYSRDGIYWQGTLFEGLTPNTNYTFYQRIAETSTTEASASSPGHSESTLPAPAVYVYDQNNSIIAGSGGTVTFPVSTTTIADDTYTVTLNAPPSGVTLTAPGKIVTSTGVGELSLTVSSGVTAGTYPMTIEIDNTTSGSFDLIVLSPLSSSATVSVGIQDGILKLGTAGTTDYPVTTTGFADGSYAATVANMPAGVTVQGGMVTITGNSGILTLETTNTSPQGFTSNLQLTLVGKTSNNFSLYIGPVSMVPVGTITVTGADITTDHGSSLMIATVLPSDATFKDIQWSVTNGTGSAIISATGLLTATGNGTVTVVAAALDGSNVSGDLVITISGQTAPPDPTVPRINGPSSLKLVKNYEATSVAFAVTGTAPVTVTKTAGDSHFTWNSATNALDIAPGLPVGNYEVELTASNPLSPKARFFFTLTVVEAFYFVNIGTFPGGTVTADVYYIADEGQTVTLTITPNEFFTMNDIRVVKTADASVVISLSGTGATRTFTMPAHDVTVTASFLDSRATNIDDVKANGIKVYVQSGTLYVNGLVPGAAWSVYNVTGTLIYKGVAGSDTANMVLPGRGIYIVRTAEKAIKVSN